MTYNVFGGTLNLAQLNSKSRVDMDERTEGTDLSSSLLTWLVTNSCYTVYTQSCV